MKIALLAPDNRDENRRWNDPAPYFGTAPAALIDGFSRLPEVEVHLICCVHQKMAGPEKLAANVFYHALNVSSPGWRWLYSGCVLAIRRKLSEIQPDIVHGQGTERYCALSAALSGFPNVVTVHGNMREIVKYYKGRDSLIPRLTARLEAFTLPRTGGVVCITSYTKRLVEGLARKVWIVPNGVDPAFFEIPREEASSIPELFVVANVCKWKNQNALIKALDPLNGKEFRLVFCGRADPGSPYAEEFLQLVSQRPWCRHEGFLSAEGLRSRLSSAAAVVLPSLEDNCPMVLLEAMAAGVPVAGSRVGGIPDLIEHGTTGLLFAPHEPAQMLRAVESLLRDRGDARGMAAEAKARAWAKFHPKVVAQRHIEIYREVLRT